MKIQLVRNATITIETGGKKLLVDPCLSKKGRLPPFTFFKRRPRLNPTVGLPENVSEILENIDAALLTHFRGGHLDHLDPAGAKFLRENNIPVFCAARDEKAVLKKGLKALPVSMDSSRDCFTGAIRAVPAFHGRGLSLKLMGPGVGYFIQNPDEPSLYIAGDTVLTKKVKKVLKENKPDICVINAGGAVLDVGQPILMPMEEVVEFVRLAPGKVVAVHMEALNHCATTRELLRERLGAEDLCDKVIIPEDGQGLAL